MLEYLKMMLFYSKTKKIKYFLDSPPPQRHMDTNGRDMCLFIAEACDLDFY